MFADLNMKVENIFLTSYNLNRTEKKKRHAKRVKVTYIKTGFRSKSCLTQSKVQESSTVIVYSANIPSVVSD